MSEMEKLLDALAAVELKTGVDLTAAMAAYTVEQRKKIQENNTTQLSSENKILSL